MTLRSAGPGAAGLAGLFAFTSTVSAQAGLGPLEAEIPRIAQASGASVGVGIRHLESGRELYLDGHRAYLMGSTFNVAVAVELLTRVDQGRERLDRLVPLRAADLFPSGSLLSERFRDQADPGAHLALIRYLELMLILSDNAATDVILREIGGTAAVTARLRSLGIQDMRVDRTAMEIYRDYTGVPALPPTGAGSIEGGLPPGTPVANQTGAYGTDVARAAYDWFVFASPR